MLSLWPFYGLVLFIKVEQAHFGEFIEDRHIGLAIRGVGKVIEVIEVFIVSEISLEVSKIEVIVVPVMAEIILKASASSNATIYARG